MTITERGNILVAAFPQPKHCKPCGEQPIWREYFDSHRCCPVCGSDHIESTTMSPVIGWDAEGNITQIKDYNHAGCRCGWRGRVHDLKPPSPISEY